MIIKILALSSALKEMKSIKNSMQVMENIRYTTIVANDIFFPTLFCANTDEYRLNSLIEAIRNDHHQVLWCLNGGYGSARILPGIEQFLQCRIVKKIFIGFSDNTAVNLFLYQKLGWNKVIHGMNYNQIADSFTGEVFDMNNFALIDKILDGTAKSIIFHDLKPLNNSAKSLKVVCGKITGGNLSILQTSLNTTWEIDTINKILVIEDVSEAPYRIDRMLEHLYQAKKFNGIKALVFGHFHKCEEQTNDALNRIASLLDTQRIPVLKTELIGHGYHNYPFVYGAYTEIRASGGGFLIDIGLCL